MKMKNTMLCWAVLCLLVLVQVAHAADFYALLGVGKQATTREIRKAFKKLALEMHPDKKPDDPDAHEAFLKYNRAYEVLKDEDLRKKYDKYGEEGLKEGGPTGRNYQSWNFYKSEFGIYDDDPEIITLSRSDFEQSVLNSGDTWFVNFYSVRCSHCHELAPTWREVARELDGVIRIGAVNCGDDYMLCRQQGIQSYPSILMFPQREKYFGDRTAKLLIKYGLQQVGAAVIELWVGNFDAEMKEEELSGHPWLITFCGDGGDCLERSTSTKLAAMLEDLVNVGVLDCHSDSQSLCKKLGVEYGTYYYEAGQVKEGSGMEITSLDAREVSYAILGQLKDLTLLSKDVFRTLLDDLKSGKERVAWLIQFVEGEVLDLQLRKLPPLLGGMNVGRVDCKEMRAECESLHAHSYPLFAVLKPGGGHEIHHGRQNVAHDIAAFARDSASNSVQVLGPDDFPARVVDSPDLWFVDFFSPNCPPCMRLLPEFRKASKHMVGDVLFGTVDCDVYSQLCYNYNIRSYPTTIFYNHSIPHQFKGKHNSQHIIEFIQDTLTPPVLILTPDNYHKLVTNRTPGTVFLVDFYSPGCGPCQQLAPEWRRLAKNMKDVPNVEVGMVDCKAHLSLCQQQSIQSYPSIRLYPTNVNSNQAYSYNGWHRDAQSLGAWAFEFLPSKTTKLDKDSFSKKILKTSQPWVVDFFTSWCGHCKVFAPQFEKIAQSLEGRVKAGKVDCDHNPWLCQQAGIRSYPTVRFYKGTIAANKPQSYVGIDIDSQDAASIIDFLEKHLPKKKQVSRDEL